MGAFLEIVVFDDVFSESDQLFSDPQGLDDLEIGAKGDQNAEKLLDAVKFADVLVARFLGDDKVLERENRELVGDFDGCGVRDLHLHQGVLCLHGCAGHAIGKLG